MEPSSVISARKMETEFLLPSGNIKQEPDYEDQTVKKEPDGEEESDMCPVIKRTRTSSTSFSCPDEDIFVYCEKCQLKYEGGCPEHGHLICADNVEEDHGEDCSQDSSPQVLVADITDGQVARRQNVLQPHVCETHSDDVGTLPNGDCSTESDQMFSVCEMRTDLCVAGTSCGLQSNVEIKTHQKIHNRGKPFSCDLCGAGFASCSHLNRHVRTHTGEKPHKCAVCGAKFAQSEHLKRHKRSHTGEKPYKCDVCGVGFAFSGNLIVHKRTHTGEKPFKCDVCGLVFAQLGSLKMHKGTHTGEKPYKCDVCGLGFARSGNLVRHKKTHTGEKPYKCDVCGSTFTQSGSLKKHKGIHIRENQNINKTSNTEHKPS